MGASSKNRTPLSSPNKNNFMQMCGKSRAPEPEIALGGSRAEGIQPIVVATYTSAFQGIVENRNRQYFLVNGVAVVDVDLTWLDLA